MGCAVTQTKDTTTVTAPDPNQGGELVGVDVNMADMTDAFLTASVVAASGDPVPPPSSARSVGRAATVT